MTKTVHIVHNPSSNTTNAYIASSPMKAKRMATAAESADGYADLRAAGWVCDGPIELSAASSARLAA